MVIIFSDMGITVKPTPPSPVMIPESKIQGPSLVQEDNDISFSEGCCTCCVGFIDMVNSTRITVGLTRNQMSKYYCLFINWANAMVKGYGGRVVKNTGDGLLFYFPIIQESENVSAVRQCLDCSIAMMRLQPNVNMKFRSELLPDLNYRISLDYGDVSLARTMDSREMDIFSPTVNICAKINNIAAPNTVVVGGDMYQISRNLSGYSFQQTKRTISVADQLYPVYSVSEAKSVVRCLASIKHHHARTNVQGPHGTTYGEKIV